MTDQSFAADFRRQGYCILPDPLSAEELSALTDAADTLLGEAVDDDGKGRYHDIGRGEDRRFLRLRHEDFPAVESFLFGDRMRALTTALVGPTPHLFVEQFVVKGANSGASFAWHQDGGYVGFDHKPYVTFWIALDPASEANGCVYLIPRDLDRQPEIEPHRWDEVNKERVGYDGDDPGIPIECPAGTIVAFSSLTLHRSGANTTDRRRRAYVCQYAPEPMIDPATGQQRHFAKPV